MIIKYERQNVPNTSTLFLIFGIAIIYPNTSHAYLIGTAGAFLLEILAVIFTVVLIFVKKIYLKHKEPKNDKGLEKEDS